jgi:carbonic anhydrase/acetyltransferase-like protein (isoleucine patch superfamily)
MIRPFRGVRPTIASTAYVDESAQVIGDVVIGDESSVWMNAVVRGDVNTIRIGRRTNIQDGTIVHVMREAVASDRRRRRGHRRPRRDPARVHRGGPAVSSAWAPFC